MGKRLGLGDFVYEEDLEWAKLPEGWNLHEVPDVMADAQDRIILLTRGEHPVIVFDREGNCLGSFGEGLFGRPHGATLGPDGMIWIADDGDHTVRRFTPEGQLLLTIGEPNRPAPYCSGEPFNRPTKVAFDPASDELYISDGYGNARVHKYTAQGQRLFSWGDFGVDPGQFNLPHSVATDRAGRVYVADRENHRVQVFDPEGRYITQWNNLHRPCGLHIALLDGQEVAFIGQLGADLPVNKTFPNLGARVSIHDLTGRHLAWLGDAQRGEGPGQFMSPHGIAVDSRGDLYVAEVSWSNIGRYLDPPRELRCFRKLVRIR